MHALINKTETPFTWELSVWFRSIFMCLHKLENLYIPKGLASIFLFK